MLQRHRHTQPGNNDLGLQWIQRLVERLREREDARADVEEITELKWKWRCACERAGLAGFVYTPSGVTRPIPQITNVELGPPVVLTVHVREAQTTEDFVKAASSIAPAMSVAAVDVIQMRTPWLVRIVLRTQSLSTAARRP